MNGNRATTFGLSDENLSSTINCFSHLAKMLNICWCQLLKSEDFLLFFGTYDSK